MKLYLTTRSQYTPTELPTDTQKFFDTLYGVETKSMPIRAEYSNHFFRTFTRTAEDERLFASGLRTWPNRGLHTKSREANKSANFMHEHSNDMNTMYDTFHIPKKTGGLRTISAPKPELKVRQREIKDWIIDTMKALPHDCAFAYVQHRTGKDALIRHQRNESRWFLKVDLKDFFPSLTTDFVTLQLMKNAAFNKFQPSSRYYADALMIWNEILAPCFLNGALPQGAVTSPLLSNLAMVPTDFEISGELFNLNKHRFIYTRYADDLLISCKEKFNPEDVLVILRKHLGQLTINDKKTRFGSSAGANWNLGIMYNDQFNLTIGHKRKARFRSALFSFLKDATAGKPWSIEDTRKLDGERAWFASIEPEWMNRIVHEYAIQYADTDFRTIVNSILNP